MVPLPAPKLVVVGGERAVGGEKLAGAGRMEVGVGAALAGIKAVETDGDVDLVHAGAGGDGI